MSNLLIVESPSKAKTIGRYLGPDYIVKASMGHLRDLPKSKMGVDLEHDFTPQYIPVRGKESLIKELKAEASMATSSSPSAGTRTEKSPLEKLWVAASISWRGRTILEVRK